MRGLLKTLNTGLRSKLLELKIQKDVQKNTISQIFILKLTQKGVDVVLRARALI